MSRHFWGRAFLLYCLLFRQPRRGEGVGEWFARLLGADDPYGWDENGPDYAPAPANFVARTDRPG